MNLLNFIEQYLEQAYIAHFKAQRDQNRVICKKCGGNKHIWLKNKLNYECKHCHSRQSLIKFNLAGCEPYRLQGGT